MRRIVITTHSWSSLSVRSRKKDSEFQTIIYFTLIVVSLFICQIFSSKLKRKLVTFSIYMRKMCPNLHTFLPYWKIINLWVEARRIIANFSSPHAAKSRFLLSSFLLYIFKNLISHLDWTKYFRKRFLKEIGYSRSFVATKSFFQCEIEKSNSKRHLPILFPNSYIWYQNKIIRLWWGPKLYLGFEGSPQSHFDIKERWHCYLRPALSLLQKERERETRTLVIKNVQRTFYDTQLHLRVESFWITPSSWQAGLDKGWVPKSDKIGVVTFHATQVGGGTKRHLPLGHLSNFFGQPPH